MPAEEILSVKVKPQFQRSVRLDTDFDRPDALAGYIMQHSPRNALLTVARHVNDTKQRAFTWTGPYGGGKSSLALMLAQLARGSTVIPRENVKDVLRINAGDEISRAFVEHKPWLVLPVVGRRELVEDAIGAAIDKYAKLRGRKPIRKGRRDVIAELVRRAESEEYGGVLLILDELGKFLEAAAAAAEDIFFYQELAEAASRARGRMVVIGVLHQAFEQYAVRLGREIREEWAKVQGRYVDIPIVAGTDEVLELIGGALTCNLPHPNSARVAERIAASIRQRRPASPTNLAESLDRCWPLHPVTAALLGPSSRCRFGQNERSIFGFLTSVEPLGFREFLRSHPPHETDSYYLPARYWDYLRTNLETAILSSSEGHRWALGAEAVERVEARFGEPHVSLVKTVGLIELFRNGSGIAAGTDVLVESLQGYVRNDIEAALYELTKASVLIYRKHLQAWGIYAGSDFDIENAVIEARSTADTISEAQIRALAMLPPITARRHYIETGTLRWFDREVMPVAEVEIATMGKRSPSRTGSFVLLLPSSQYSEQKSLQIACQLSEQQRDQITLYGVPRGQLNIMEQAVELAALEHVARNRPELEGDAVARREIDARLRQQRSNLEGMLRDAFVSTQWYFDGDRYDVEALDGLSPLASKICDQVFPSTPCIHSELVNRDTLSSSAAKAQRVLLHRMIAYGSRPNLDYDGYPADAGLYYTILTGLGIHQNQGKHWAFTSPSSDNPSSGPGSLMPWWERTREVLEAATGPVTLAELYDVWRKAPFGLKQGVLPILALSYLLANRSQIAVYVEGTFISDLSDASVDEWLQDPARVAWKVVRLDKAAKRFLMLLAEKLEEVLLRPVIADPLDSARGLVSLVLALPGWTQRTTHLSERTRTVRTLLLRASDPIKVIFADLPELLGTEEPEQLVESLGQIVSELSEAYPKALRKIHDQLLKALDHVGNLEALQARACVVRGISGDFKIDAFAGRLQTFSGEFSGIEGLVSLAVSKPSQGFTDHDLDYAMLQLSKWAFEFRRVEALASIQGRSSTRRALAVVFGGERTISGTFDVAEGDTEVIRLLADGMLDRLLAGNVTPDLFLAALVEAGARVLELQQQEKS